MWLSLFHDEPDGHRIRWDFRGIISIKFGVGASLTNMDWAIYHKSSRHFSCFGRLVCYIRGSSEISHPFAQVRSVILLPNEQNDD